MEDFIAVDCECMNKDSLYDLGSTAESQQCDHSKIISDKNMIKFTEIYLQDKRNDINITNIAPEREFALKLYDSKIDYEQECNAVILELSDL